MEVQHHLTRASTHTHTCMYTQILAVVNHFKAQGHKVELKLTDEEGKPVAMPEKRKH